MPDEQVERGEAMAEPQKKIETSPQDMTAAPPPWVSELLRALKPQGPLEQAGLSPERIAQIKELPKPQRWRDIPWQSEETGATGIAHVIESKKFTEGRITSIAGYTHPPASYKTQSEGGMVPDGFHMWADKPRTIEGIEPQQGDLNQGFLQWRYETFYKADLARYIGKAITTGCSDPAGAGLKTPWQESRVGAVSQE
jgi:hypothetical protein